MTKKKKNAGNAQSAPCSPPEEQQTTVYSEMKGFRILNVLTREQYYAWSRDEAMQMLTTKLKHWVKFHIEEGMFPEFLFYS